MDKAIEALNMAIRLGNRETYLRAIKEFQAEVHKAQSRRRK